MGLPKEFAYQKHIRRKVVERGRTAVIAPPGAGKTRPIIDALVERGVIDPQSSCLFPQGSIFIMCTGSALPTWRRQIPEWADDPLLADDIHIVRGPKHKRMQLWKVAATAEGRGVYITNFSCFYRDFFTIKLVPWAAAIADEYHKVMRSRKSTTFKRFRTMTRHMKVMILASGSLVSKGPPSMFTAFNLIAPAMKLFRSYWRFIGTFCLTQEGDYGREIIGTRNLERLRDLMDEYLAYIPAEVVADQLPEGLRSPLDVEMDEEQARLYKAISEEMIAFTDSGEVIFASTVLAQLLRLRQLLCCPRAVDPSLGMGAGFESIVERMEDEGGDKHVIIFVPFRPSCEIICDELRARGYDANMLRGGADADEIQAKTEYFRNTRSILVITIAFAESFDLETCKTSYFLGYDYNIDPNEQAEGRTKRAISKHEFVTYNYIKYVGTIDEIMLLNLTTDMHNVRKILSRPKAIIDALKGVTYND